MHICSPFVSAGSTLYTDGVGPHHVQGHTVLRVASRVDSTLEIKLLQENNI